MIVNSDVDIYSKTQNHRKTPGKSQKANHSVIPVMGFPVSGLGNNYVQQGPPNHGSRTISGPQNHFIRPAKPFCQQWRNIIFTENLLV